VHQPGAIGRGVLHSESIHRPDDEGGSMNRDDTEDDTIYKVVVNHEEQYSIWPADRENSLCWKNTGREG
jgi:MbtH-like protein